MKRTIPCRGRQLVTRPFAPAFVGFFGVLPAVMLAVMLAVPLAMLALSLAPAGTSAAPGAAMPEFSDRSPQAWINSQPLTRADLKGKVVLLEIYASG